MMRLPAWPGRDWAPLPVPFLMWSIAGVVLIELVATEVFSGAAPLDELIVIRGFELVWMLLVAWRTRASRLLGLGWPGRAAARVFALLAAGSCLIALAAALAMFVIEPERLQAWLRWIGPPSWARGEAGMLAMMVLAPLTEELFFRAVVYRLLRQAFGWPVALPLSALCFASVHGALLSPPLAGGLVFALGYEWSRSLWVAVLLHAGANAAVWWLGSLF